MRKFRLAPDDRRRKILEATVPLAEKQGYEGLTRSKIAKAARVSDAVLNYHFGSMAAFKEAFVNYAVENEILKVVAEAALRGVNLPDELRRRALESLH